MRDPSGTAASSERPTRLNPARFRPNLFVAVLPAAVLLAWYFPGPGSREGAFSLGTIALAGVSAVFFGYGLRTEWDKFLAGLRLWKMHLLIQGITFLLFPLLVYPWGFWLTDPQDRQVWQGIFFLAALPSTISSSAVLVSLTGGNLPLAVVNAGLSGFIGVLATPLWMIIAGERATGNLHALGMASLRLSLLILAPMIAGALLTPWLGEIARRHERWLRRADQLVVLLIVYTSFSRSFEQGLPPSLSTSGLVVIGLAVLALFGSVVILVPAICRLSGVARPEGLTVFFCGCTKSLSHGVVMARVLFGSQSLAALVIVPVMVYHFIQLTVFGLVAAIISPPPSGPER
ncbi:MAG TPA: bile acid:sodium symporter family protein [Candidatus Hydrogenedentes bacterium]|nr:bile acid:sodium symporter family protein [Candidatus Hydrogenedentota bacterium]HOV60622.1 bile acid:sodium symporter family protein [Candidatus Hydrogenedentota bacterium]